MDLERETFTKFRRKLVFLQQDLEDICQDTERNYLRKLSNSTKLIRIQLRFSPSA